MVPAPGKIRPPGTVVALMIITLGLYGLFYYYDTFESLKRWRGGEGLSGAVVLLLSVFVPGAALMLPWLLPAYVGRMYRRHNLPAPITGHTGWWCLLPLIGMFVWVFKVQGALNDFWAGPAKEMAARG